MDTKKMYEGLGAAGYVSSKAEASPGIFGLDCGKELQPRKLEQNSPRQSSRKG